MLMPEDGHFACSDKCGFVTCDIFEFLDHCGVEFGWNVKLNKRYSFDLFEFLLQLNRLTNLGDLDAMQDHIQNATLLMVNASDDELEEFIEEMVIESEMEDLIKDLDALLKDTNE